jgi:hypothetical protein
MLAEARRSQVQIRPFRPDWSGPHVVVFEPRETEPLPRLPGVPATGAPATGGPSDAIDALVERLATLARQCDGRQWFPATSEQYRAFQQLALELLEAAAIADSNEVSADRRRVLNEAINRALAAEIEWTFAAKRKAVNQLASQAIDEGASKGLYAFGEVTYPVGRITINERPTVGLELSGTRETVFVPVAFGGDDLLPGTRWLIFGAYLGRIGDLSGEEGVPGARRASLIEAKHLVGEPAGSPASPLPDLTPGR